MKLVSNLMKAPQVATIMQEFSKEMTKVSQLWLRPCLARQLLYCWIMFNYSRFLCELVYSLPYLKAPKSLLQGWNFSYITTTLILAFLSYLFY
ncbi:hypothetical protein KSP39_PZI014035 [Platanthera zijinensis]|uniref:Uncharacterized protein n=1 Tax=Platanthera zijinensis TaxID=2320716 RepID=A0AAP0BDS8_9ASPA